MDKKTLIKNLNRFFCDLSKEGKKYSEVWLEEADFGGLYMSDKFTLRVKAQHHIEDSTDEIRDIVFLLFKKNPVEYKYIFQVAVYNAENAMHCQPDDIMVFEEDKACP